ncbi:hypothetical protein PAXRUDRAFT_353530 [Paxillus rubicundulus Ve08.2h10]|uniref:Uncharacterized protein n=1 Tax=Paxillus rubicundulus Ve08.2h10 TaxID=930991 RepID=A0A0D0DRQ2_9AGAM|nr:hypothetical protein PAXRUDRAFT_353530 [Paxillus rubicundulus Ve08.2h10]
MTLGVNVKGSECPLVTVRHPYSSSSRMKLSYDSSCSSPGKVDTENGIGRSKPTCNLEYEVNVIHGYSLRPRLPGFVSERRWTDTHRKISCGELVMTAFGRMDSGVPSHPFKQFAWKIIMSKIDENSRMQALRTSPGCQQLKAFEHVFTK